LDQMVVGVELLVECCPSFVAWTAAVLVLTAGVHLHHHWSGHRSVVAVGRCGIWRSHAGSCLRLKMTTSSR
jgi:hypothetical protein